MEIGERLRKNEAVLLRFNDILSQMRNADNLTDINALIGSVEDNGAFLFKEKKDTLTKTQKTLFEIAEDRYKALYGELKFY